MDDYKSFLGLDNKGSVLFIFSDRNNIFAVYEDMEDNCYYMFMMDKHFIIEAISAILLPDEFKGKKVEWLKWFKPYQQANKCYSFSGICKLDNVSYRFTINDTSVLTLGSEEKLLPDSVQRDFKCLQGIEVESFSQRQNGVVHLVGLDTKYKEQVYCVVDLDKDICVKRYHLRSDEGDLKVNMVNVDTHDMRVYLCGEVSRFNEADDSFLYSTPYVETFLLHRV